MALHHYRSRSTGQLVTISEPHYANDPNWEPTIPVSASLVTDELLGDLTQVANTTVLSDRSTRLTALRDALIAGRPVTEPLAEPTDPGARVLTRHDEELARVGSGQWVGPNGAYADWGHASSDAGPLRLADGGSDDRG